MDFVSALIETARKMNSGPAVCQEKHGETGGVMPTRMGQPIAVPVFRFHGFEQASRVHESQLSTMLRFIKNGTACHNMFLVPQLCEISCHLCLIDDLDFAFHLDRE